MTSLASADALIIDLRDNAGCLPAMIAYVSSHLFQRRTTRRPLAVGVR
jgi:hypothetical protein